MRGSGFASYYSEAQRAETFEGWKEVTRVPLVAISKPQRVIFAGYSAIPTNLDGVYSPNAAIRTMATFDERKHDSSSE